jgi:hypothetical protein
MMGRRRDQAMKTLRSLFAACAFTALSAGAAVAGSPDDPGAIGRTIGEAKAFAQDAADNKNGWGQAIKENNAAGNPSLGQQIQAAKDFIGASPNPANDRGKGND